jgi:hypothetical protein
MIEKSHTTHLHDWHKVLLFVMVHNNLNLNILLAIEEKVKEVGTLERKRGNSQEIERRERKFRRER